VCFHSEYDQQNLVVRIHLVTQHASSMGSLAFV
jgi:hypothetical protein